MKTRAVRVFLAVIAVCFACEGYGATETRFTILDSSTSSWVARGLRNYTVTPDDGWLFRSSRNFDNGVGISLGGLALPRTTVTSWRMNFAAPNNDLITPGLYEGFARFPFQAIDQPGLEFSSTGRLDNRASGVFEVHEATYSPTGDVLSFSADFTHYGEANVSRYAIVEVRYNATVIPEPATAGLLLGMAVLAAAGRQRRRTPACG